MISNDEELTSEVQEDTSTTEEEIITADDTATSNIDADDTSNTDIIEEVVIEDTVTAVDVILSTTGEVIVDEANEFVIGYELFKDSISFSLKIKGTGGFAAIGIPRSGLNMMDADILAAVADGSSCNVGDYWSVTFANPSEDSSLGGTDDLIDKICVINGDYLEASFSRSLKTEDPNDNEIIPDNLEFIYAFATAGGLVYHGPTG